MELIKLIKFKGQKNSHSETDGYILQISRDEALTLMHSMLGQMMHQSANTGRLESYINGEYFSISVHDNAEINLRELQRMQEIERKAELKAHGKPRRLAANKFDRKKTQRKK